MWLKPSNQSADKGRMEASNNHPPMKNTNPLHQGAFFKTRKSSK
jgi:hypothetical protein